MFDPYQYPMSHNQVFPLEFLKLGHPHVQEIIMFFVQVARWYFVPTVPHWNWFDPLKSFEDNLQEAVPKRIQHTQTSNPVSTFDILPVSQISPHSGSPQWPAMDCHRPLDFCCAVRAPGAPATPAAAVPQRRCRRGPRARRGAAAPGAGPNRADAAGIPRHGSWKPLEI